MTPKADSHSDCCSFRMSKVQRALIHKVVLSGFLEQRKAPSVSVQPALRAGPGTAQHSQCPELGSETGRAVASQSCNFLLLYKFHVGNVK